MERIKDDFLDMLETLVPLKGRVVLDIGCGDGSRSATLAPRCQNLIGIDINEQLIGAAKKRQLPNASFYTRPATATGCGASCIDVVIFSLSFHHLHVSAMPRAISEAVRVVKKDGYIVFFEPGFDGAFFDAEIRFDACDGDERDAKKAAQLAILRHPDLTRPAVVEFVEETGFRFDSTQDFIATMKPKKNLHALEDFLRRYDFCLKAVRHTQIFKPRT